MKILINDKLIDEDVINRLAERFCCTVQEIEMLLAKIAMLRRPLRDYRNMWLGSLALSMILRSFSLSIAVNVGTPIIKKVSLARQK